MTFKNLSIFVLASVLLWSCTSSKSVKENNQKPGYYQQWLYMKTNGTNQLPDMSKYSWDVVSSKRSNSSALLTVSEVGPRNVGGRIKGMVIDYSTPNRILAGAASGGVFESLDNGASWKALNDQALSPSVTYMHQSPLNPKLIYYCTGEASGNSADLIGKGVFRSVDGGKSFDQLPSTNNSNFEFCWSLKTSPIDTNTLYVSTNGKGLWKSINRGDSFYRVYNSGVEMNDLEVFPDGSVMFTLKGTGVYRSNTGEINTFTKIASIPSASTARMELAYCKNFPNVVYAAVSGPDNSYNGVLQNFYKSSDGGKTFTVKSNPNGTVGFGFTWYTLTMEVNSNDSNDIFIGSVTSGYSLDGAQTWYEANDQHADHHIAVSSGNRVYVGSDGGICYYNWGAFNNYTNLNNGLNVTQFYHGDVSPLAKDIFGGCQDNGTKEGKNMNPTFSSIYGADGGYSFYHPTKSGTRYFATQNGYVYRNGTNIMRNLPVSTDAKWFIHPYTVSKTHGEFILYPAGVNVYFSSNEGNSFKKLGNVASGRLFSAELSPGSNPSAFCGGSFSLIAFDSIMNTSPKIKDLRLLMPSYIRSSFVASIKVVPGFRDRIFIGLNNIADSSRIWEVTDIFGTPVFKNIGRNLPKGLPVNWVECDPFNPEQVIFAGTDYGLYVTEDGGLTWVKDTRIPSTVVRCIQVEAGKKDIYFFTHGRGIFKGVINNAGESSVQNIQEEILKSAYPVPATNELVVEMKDGIDAKYQLIDGQGKVVLTGTLTGGANSINTSEISSGNYILVYQSESFQGNIRFNILH